MQLVLNCICHVEHTGKNHMRWVHYILLPMRKGRGLCIPYQTCHTRAGKPKCLPHHQRMGVHTAVWSLATISSCPCRPLFPSRGWIRQLKPPPRGKQGIIMWEVSGSVSECGSRNSSTDFTQNCVKSEMVKLWTRSTKSETLGLGPRYHPGF